jgi:hypothetical protein
VLKRSSIDKYIQHVTAGLPQLERVDTAAELRVHLLQKTRELMAQGFLREEAEHLAVQEMGPVAATNRALLGHIFTGKFGWRVLGFAALTIVAWIGWNFRYIVFWPQAEIRSREIAVDELSNALGNGTLTATNQTAFDLTLPRGTKWLHLSTWRYSKSTSAFEDLGGIAVGSSQNAPTHLRLVLIEGRYLDQQGRGVGFNYSDNGSWNWMNFGNFFHLSWFKSSGNAGPAAPWKSSTATPRIIDNLSRGTIELNKWLPIAYYADQDYTQEKNPREAAIIGVLASSSEAMTSRFPQKICFHDEFFGSKHKGFKNIKIVQMKDFVSIPTAANGCAASR